MTAGSGDELQVAAAAQLAVLERQAAGHAGRVERLRATAERQRFERDWLRAQLAQRERRARQWTGDPRLAGQLRRRNSLDDEPGYGAHPIPGLPEWEGAQRPGVLKPSVEALVSADGEARAQWESWFENMAADSAADSARWVGWFRAVSERGVCPWRSLEYTLDRVEAAHAATIAELTRAEANLKGIVAELCQRPELPGPVPESRPEFPRWNSSTQQEWRNGDGWGLEWKAHNRKQKQRSTSRRKSMSRRQLALPPAPQPAPHAIEAGTSTQLAVAATPRSARDLPKTPRQRAINLAVERDSRGLHGHTSDPGQEAPPTARRLLLASRQMASRASTPRQDAATQAGQLMIEPAEQSVGTTLAMAQRLWLSGEPSAQLSAICSCMSVLERATDVQYDDQLSWLQSEQFTDGLASLSPTELWQVAGSMWTVINSSDQRAEQLCESMVAVWEAGPSQQLARKPDEAWDYYGTEALIWLDDCLDKHSTATPRSWSAVLQLISVMVSAGTAGSVRWLRGSGPELAQLVTWHTPKLLERKEYGQFKELAQLQLGILLFTGSDLLTGAYIAQLLSCHWRVTELAEWVCEICTILDRSQLNAAVAALVRVPSFASATPATAQMMQTVFLSQNLRSGAVTVTGDARSECDDPTQIVSIETDQLIGMHLLWRVATESLELADDDACFEQLHDTMYEILRHTGSQHLTDAHLGMLIGQAWYLDAVAQWVASAADQLLFDLSQIEAMLSALDQVESLAAATCDTVRMFWLLFLCCNTLLGQVRWSTSSKDDALEYTGPVEQLHSLATLHRLTVEPFDKGARAKALGLVIDRLPDEASADQSAEPVEIPSARPAPQPQANGQSPPNGRPSQAMDLGSWFKGSSQEQEITTSLLAKHESMAPASIASDEKRDSSIDDPARSPPEAIERKTAPPPSQNSWFRSPEPPKAQPEPSPGPPAQIEGSDEPGAPISDGQSKQSTPAVDAAVQPSPRSSPRVGFPSSRSRRTPRQFEELSAGPAAEQPTSSPIARVTAPAPQTAKLAHEPARVTVPALKMPQQAFATSVKESPRASPAASPRVGFPSRRVRTPRQAEPQPVSEPASEPTSVQAAVAPVQLARTPDHTDSTQASKPEVTPIKPAELPAATSQGNKATPVKMSPRASPRVGFPTRRVRTPRKTEDEATSSTQPAEQPVESSTQSPPASPPGPETHEQIKQRLLKESEARVRAKMNSRSPRSP